MLAGGRADRRRPGALPRLLVVLSARPALPAGGPARAVRAVAADLADRARARRRDRRRCSPTRSRGRARRAAGRRSPRGPAALLAMAYPSGPHPFPIALALALGALLAFERRPAARRACWSARAPAWRIEFAAFAGAGDPARRAATARRGCAASALRRGRGVAAVLYLPVVIAAGLGPRVGPARRLPADRLPRLPGAAVPARLRRPAEHRLARRLPGRQRRAAAAASTCRSCWCSGSRGAAGRARRGAGSSRCVIATGVFALGTLAYLLVRTDLFHTAPLAVMVAVLGRVGARRRGRAAPAACRAALARASRSPSRSSRGRPPLARRCARTPSRSTCRSPTACACRRAQAARARGGRAPSAARCRRAPIYVAARRADLVTSGHPLLYVLADRANPTRYDIPAPGVVTSAPVQREIVARPRAHPHAAWSCAGSTR